MTLLAIGLDSLLALVLVWLAWQVLHGPNLFRAVVSFMVFGLLMAIAWVRLEAPDIALADAALSAGLTGALLLSTLGRLPGRYGIAEVEKIAPRSMKQHLWRWSNALLWGPLITGLVILLGLTAWFLPAPGLGDAVYAELYRSGVENAVTAVLLNFRAFDTLLEISVLLLAVVTIWSFGPALSPIAPRVPSPTLPALARLLSPVFVLVATYLLWQGTHAPGGAFPAGAVLGAGGVLLMLAGASPWSGVSGERLLRWLLVLGLAVFLTVALGVMVVEEGFLQYPLDWSGSLIMLIEATAGLSIGVMLMALYIGGRPRAQRGGRDRKA